MSLLTVRPRGSDQRLYSRHGARIMVYDDAQGSMPLLWSIDGPSETAAEALMRDLYYGEYTGA